VLKTVTSLEPEDGPDLDEYEAGGLGRKTDDEHDTIYIYTHVHTIVYYNYVIYKMRPIYILIIKANKMHYISILF